MPQPTEKHGSGVCFYERLHHSKEWTIFKLEIWNPFDRDDTHGMECAPFLELNERLKTDVTVERMCLYKGLTHRIFEYESKPKTMCSAIFLTSRM